MNTLPKSNLAASNLTSGVLLAATLIVFSGCKSGPPKPSPVKLGLQIQTSERAASLTIPVYIGAANQTYDKSWMEENVDQLLERIRTTHSIDVKSFELTPGGTNITKQDPKWDIWLRQKHADHLVVVADLPKSFGGESHRRVQIPLDKKLWKQLPSDKTIHVEVLETGVTLLDAPGL